MTDGGDETFGALARAIADHATGCYANWSTYDHQMVDLADKADAEIERLRSALSAEREECAKTARLPIACGCEAVRLAENMPGARICEHHYKWIARIVRFEREECAEEHATVAEYEGQKRADGGGEVWIAQRIAAAIRARKGT